MKFNLEIKNETNPEEDKKIYLDEATAIDKAAKKGCIVAYY